MPFSSKTTFMRLFETRRFHLAFLRRSILRFFAVLRLFRLLFLYILLLTFIKGFLIKVNTFRVLCGIKSGDFIKNDRALCAPSPIFLQLTIRSRPVDFYFSMPISASFFFVFYRKFSSFLTRIFVVFNTKKTILHGYEKARPKSRFFALLKLYFSFYQFAKCVWEVSHFCFLIGSHNAYMPSVITDKSTHFIHVPKS